MNIEDIKQRITGFSNELYPFAHALIPEELQAQQLVVDGIAFLFADKECKLRLFDLLEVTEHEFVNKEFFDLKKVSIRVIYALAKKRFSQLEAGLDVNQFGVFYRLGPSARAAMFLKYKFGLDADELGEILSLSKIEVMTLLHESRAHMNDFIRPAQEPQAIYAN